jgi:Cft2 family RNA processing exonuclease
MEEVCDLYFQSKKDIKSCFMECIRRVQLVHTDNENEEILKKEFIKQFIEFRCEIFICYFSEYDDFIKKIEDSLGDKIFLFASQISNGEIIKKV